MATDVVCSEHNTSLYNDPKLLLVFFIFSIAPPSEIRCCCCYYYIHMYYKDNHVLLGRVEK